MSKPNFSIDEVLREAWKITKRSWFQYLKLFVLVIAVYVLAMVLYGFLSKELIKTEVFLLTWPLQALVTIIAVAYLKLVSTRVGLQAARNKPVALFTHSKVSPSTYGHALLGEILFTIIRFIGYIAFIIPGIIANVMFPFYIYSIADKGASAVGGLEDSMRLTNGNKLSIFLFRLILSIFTGLVIMIPVVVFTTVFIGTHTEDFNGTLSVAASIIGVVGIVFAVVVVAVSEMLKLSGMSYMYLKMREQTPFNK